MALYRKKPVIIEAVRLLAFEPLDGPTFSETPEWLAEALESGVIRFVTGDSVDGSDWTYAEIETLEGTMLAKTDDWIIRGVAGELYPCKPDIFSATYGVA